MDTAKIQDGIRHMQCTACSWKWLALCFKSSEHLECPACGYMVQVTPSDKGAING